MERIRNMAKAGSNSGKGGEDEGTKRKKGKKDEESYTNIELDGLSHLQHLQDIIYR